MSEEELGKGRLHKGHSAERSVRASGWRSRLRARGGQSQAPRVKQAALDNCVLCFRQHHRALVVQVSECAFPQIWLRCAQAMPLTSPVQVHTGSWSV